MRKILPVLLAALFAAACAATQPGQAHFWRSKRWYAAEAAMSATMVVDGLSTAKVKSVCPVCKDGNPIIGHSSKGSTIALGLLAYWASETGFAIAAHEVLREDTATWRFLGTFTVPVEISIVEVVAATHNYKLAADCRKAKLNCAK